MIGCIIGAHKCCNVVGVVFIGLEMAFIDSCVIQFGMVGFGGDNSDGVRFCGVCIGFLTIVLNIFDRQYCVIECVLVCLPSKVGMVAPSECFLVPGLKKVSVLEESCLACLLT